MLTTLDRLTIYAVLCFISLCALGLGETTQAQLMPVLGTAASIFGIWLEMRSEPRHHSATTSLTNVTDYAQLHSDTIPIFLGLPR